MFGNKNYVILTVCWQNNNFNKKTYLILVFCCFQLIKKKNIYFFACSSITHLVILWSHQQPILCSLSPSVSFSLSLSLFSIFSAFTPENPLYIKDAEMILLENFIFLFFEFFVLFLFFRYCLYITNQNGFYFNLKKKQQHII